METPNFQINLAPGVDKADIIIREVNTANELATKPPVKLQIIGTITAPLEYLTKRHDVQEQIDQKRCHILVDREKISIQLITNENDEYKKGSVTGKLEFYPKFMEFGINAGREWSPSELGIFLKMNRAFFTSKQDNMKLVTDLMHFKAKIDSKVEQAVKERGDRTDNFSQVVHSNLPDKFNIKIPILKGYPPEEIEIETFAQINGREVSFVLISPAAQETLENLRNIAIDTQLDGIRKLTPDIAIIEQ